MLSGYNDNFGTLTIEKKINGVYGTLKVFDLTNRDNLVLGVSLDSRVEKHTPVFNGDVYTFKLNNSEDFSNIKSALVQKVDDKYIPILWGRKGGYDEILAEFNRVYINSVVDNSGEEHLFESTDEEIEELIDEEIGSQIENEEELEKFLDEKIASIENETDIFESENSKLENFEGKEFFNLISEQIDDLFDNYPRVDELEELIPNSKWVKINFENNGNEYVLGLIYDNFDLKYICYGVPGKFGSVPPKHLGECQWLPLDPKNPIDGYWVIYQDANTGDKVDII